MIGGGSALNQEKIGISGRTDVTGAYIAGPTSFLEKEGVKREQIRFSPIWGHWPTVLHWSPVGNWMLVWHVPERGTGILPLRI